MALFHHLCLSAKCWAHPDSEPERCCGDEQGESLGVGRTSVNSHFFVAFTVIPLPLIYSRPNEITRTQIIISAQHNPSAISSFKLDITAQHTNHLALQFLEFLNSVQQRCLKGILQGCCCLFNLLSITTYNKWPIPQYIHYRSKVCVIKSILL